MRKTLSKEDILDLVAFGILTPIEKTNTIPSWKFRKRDLTEDLFKRLNYIRNLRHQEILADKIEREWKPV